MYGWSQGRCWEPYLKLNRSNFDLLSSVLALQMTSPRDVEDSALEFPVLSYIQLAYRLNRF